MNKNRENFIKYSNDLYFHHLLVENERIRTLILQWEKNQCKKKRIESISL